MGIDGRYIYSDLTDKAIKAASTVYIIYGSVLNSGCKKSIWV